MWAPEGSEPTDRAKLDIPFARSFAAHIEEACGDFARLVECRTLPSKKVELVSFELQIGVPQRPVYPILDKEVVTVCFFDETSPPLVAVARENFPDTPHQNVVPEGLPSILCIDDRPWQDTKSSYTASELMARIQIWFSKACEGELHGIDQPFDPVFPYDGDHTIILTCDGADALETGGKLSIWAVEQPPRYLLVSASSGDRPKDIELHAHVLHLKVEPDSMRRMRRTPRTLRDLHRFLAERGADLADAFNQSLGDWLATDRQGSKAKWITCILVSLPQVHPRTGEIGATQPIAFLCPFSPGEIGQAMGVLGKSPVESTVRPYVRLLGASPNSDELLHEIQVAPVDTELDGERASELAGRAKDLREVVLVGAGSLGSHLAESLAREGLFRWSVVDDDVLLPHNVGRHTLTRAGLGISKAPQLAGRLFNIRRDTAPQAYSENVLAGVLSEKLSSALAHAEIIIDASASIPVSRWVSDLPGQARGICAFFAPNGRSAVMMAEAVDRSTTLRDLEAVYLRELLINPALEGHLAGAEAFRYSGACRALTNRIPASAVAVLSGLLADAIAQASLGSKAQLRIWSWRENGSIDAVTCGTETFRFSPDTWQVTVPRQLLDELDRKRAAKLPDETGGPLVGFVDRETSRIVIAAALEPPSDSIGAPSSFTRGRRGFKRQLESVKARSGGQLGYVGEWHSHPRGATSHPSSTDIRQIVDLSDILGLDEYPAVSLIVSEKEKRMLLGRLVR